MDGSESYYRSEGDQGLITSPQTVSLVVPVFNEEASIPSFLVALRAVLESIEPRVDYEILFVNDGSQDATERTIMSAAQQSDRIGLINLSRNFGKEAALFAGLKNACGEAIIPIDVDLQDPPEVITEMIATWRAGAKIVNARRMTRDYDGWFKKNTARAFYFVFNKLAEQPIPTDVGDFRLLDREVVDAICELGERSRFNKAIFSWVGFETKEVTFERPKRTSGQTAWSYWKLWKLSLDGIFASSTMPLRIWTYFGFFLAFAALAYSVVIFIRTLVVGVEVPGYASSIILILTFGGVNMLALGIIGEYVGRIYTEVRQRPVYIIRSRHNIKVSEI